jgi:hypothetical protein
LANAIFGKVLKETLEGSNDSVADGKHFIKSKLDVCYATLFIEGQVLELFVNSFDELGITGVHHQGLGPLHTCEVF